MTHLVAVARWAFASLRYRRARTALTVTGIGLAAALLVGSLAFQRGYEQSLSREIEAMGYQILVTGKGCPHEAATLILRGGSIPMYIDENVHRAVAADPEVAATTRFFLQALPSPDGRSYQIHLGIDDQFFALKPGVSFQRGGAFSGATASEVILGFNVAEFRRLGVGDSVRVLGREMTVSGVLDKLGTQDDGTIFLPLLTAQAVFDRRDWLTGVGVRLHDLAKADAFIDRMYAMPSVQVVRLSQVESAILRVLGGVRALLLTASAAGLVIALLGVVNAALMSVDERKGELGLLRALGCPAGRLFQLVWSESLLLASAGAVLGIAAVWLARGAIEIGLRRSLALLPQGSLLSFDLALIAGSMLAIVGLCLAVAVVPAFWATRVEPMTTMREGGRAA